MRIHSLRDAEQREHDRKKVEYDQISENVRALTDVRFKLLALVPTISGTAVALLTRDPEKSSLSALSIIAVSLFGLIVTFGILAYDQRNSQLYDALIGRAKRLETDLFSEAGGSYATRPGRERRFFRVLLWHDRALAIIYGAALSLWLVPLSFSVARLLGASELAASLFAGALTLVAFWSFVDELHRIERNEESGFRKRLARLGAAVRIGLGREATPPTEKEREPTD